MLPLSDRELHEISPPNGRLDYWIGRLKQKVTHNQFNHQHSVHFGSNTQKVKVVAFPEPRNKLKKEFDKSTLLGRTTDNKKIYLIDYHAKSSIIREIGRLREMTFRYVGEGTQKSRDIDQFDKTYRHIVLWDDNDNEIVGAYRIGEAGKLYQEAGLSGLYTSRLFTYQDKFIELFPNAIELGRSFVQPKYWGKRSLDYLWLGIGAYLNANPSVQYIFGAVSISNDYPIDAQQKILQCYKHFFQPKDASTYASSKTPFNVTDAATDLQTDYKDSFKALKKHLSDQELTVPTLYKQYADFCKPEGIHFIDFNIDPEFSDCVDSLVLADLRFTKKKKRQRYIEIHNANG